MLYTVHMIRVGVLRGGPSAHYDASLASGAYVLRNLPRDRYEPVDVFIDPEGSWHIGGRAITDDMLRERVDVLWNSLHGSYGEDGRVSQLFKKLSIPYVGSSPAVSAMAMHKRSFKEQVTALGIKTPRGAYVESWGEDSAEETVRAVASAIARDFSPPWIIEPIARGNGLGPVRAKTRTELVAVLEDMHAQSIPVLVEEEVLGAHASVIVVPGFRGEATYAFIPERIESIHARLRPHETKLFEDVARTLHNGLDLGPYSRMVGVLDNRGAVSVLSVETVPRTHENAELHQALAAVGSSFPELADHLIRTALGK
jgi:D-alanine-D-alanine ligase